ncbi:MAG: FecR domain-containing protein [Rikenellaceae bacterium]
MENRIDTELIIKYISGLADDEEKKRVLDWIEQNDENKKLYSQLKNYWVLERLKSYDKGELSGSKHDNNNKKRYFIFGFRNIYRIAAVLAIAVSLFGAYLLFNDKKEPVKQVMATFEYIVNSGVKGIVNLPDGSKIWLNSSSSIKCPEKFDTEKREIELEGEGYFEVVPDKEWPMYVKTSKGYTVKVTGTTFNLSSYSNDNKLIVTLISGNISLLHEQNKKEIKLNPTEEIVISDTEKPILVKNANIEYNTAWKEGYLLFDNTPMSEVIKKMERWYGVSFIIKDTSILDYRFTANFKSESITQVLEILKLSSNIRFKIDNTRITLKKF